MCCKRRLHSLGLNTFLPLSGTVIASFPPFCPNKKQNNKQATKPDGEDEQQHARSTLESNNYHGNTAKRKSQDRNVVESTCIFVLNILSWLNLNTSGQVNWINIKFKWADLFFFQSSQSLFVQRQIETKVTSRLFPIWATLNHTLSSKHLTKKRQKPRTSTGGQPANHLTGVILLKQNRKAFLRVKGAAVALLSCEVRSNL